MSYMTHAYFFLDLAHKVFCIFVIIQSAAKCLHRRTALKIGHNGIMVQNYFSLADNSLFALRHRQFQEYAYNVNDLRNRLCKSYMAHH